MLTLKLVKWAWTKSSEMGHSSVPPSGTLKCPTWHIWGTNVSVWTTPIYQNLDMATYRFDTKEWTKSSVMGHLSVPPSGTLKCPIRSDVYTYIIYILMHVSETSEIVHCYITTSYFCSRKLRSDGFCISALCFQSTSRSDRWTEVWLFFSFFDEL